MSSTTKAAELADALENGEVAAVAAAIESAGPELLAQPTDGSAGPPCNTLLHVACWVGAHELVEAMLKKGAPTVNWANQGGNAPLHLAAVQGHAKCLELLLANGADMDAKNLEQFTPLHLAARCDKAAAAAALVAGGADVHAKERKGRTPLAIAAKRDACAAARVLLAGGADPGKPASGLGALFSRSPLALAKTARMRAILEGKVEALPTSLPSAAARAAAAVAAEEPHSGGGAADHAISRKQMMLNAGR